MISRPTAYCPRCSGKYTMLDPIEVNSAAGKVIWYGECDCGAADITLTLGNVTEIISRDPVELPAYWDEPLPPQEEY